MESRFRCRIVALAAVICSVLLLASLLATAQRKPEAPRSRAKESLRQFLQHLDENKTTQYVAAFQDLNGDGSPEAIVYLAGKKWCGSGGCNTLILTRDADSWRIVARIIITRPPIRVLTKTSNGWHSIGVWVQGGGIHPGHETELRFDGKTYPRNPSAPPARRSRGNPAGEVVIPSTQSATPLYDHQSTAPDTTIPTPRG